MRDFSLRKLQAITGLVFAAFVGVHLINTWLAAFGPTAYDGVQGALRLIYQWLPVEVTILSAVAVHAVVGLTRIIREPRRELNARARWHRYAGFFLMLVIAGHVLAVRGSSWFFDVYPGFHGLAFTVDYLPGFFYPYYFALGVAGFYHGLNGIGIAAQRLGLAGRVVALQTRALTLASVGAGLAMFAALFGFGGLWLQLAGVYESDFAQLALSILADLGMETTRVPTL